MQQAGITPTRRPSRLQSTLIRSMRHPLQFMLLASVISTTAHASTVYSVSGIPDVDVSLEDQLYYDQVGYGSWTQTGSYTGVSIGATLYSGIAGDTGTAFLSTSVGTGATALYSAAFNFPSSSSGVVSLFSGLTLGPGTYYLVIESTYSGESCRESLESCSTAWIATDEVPTITEDSGVTGNGFGIAAPTPGSNPLVASYTSPDEDLFFTVTSAIPEPGTLPLLGSGLLLAVGIKLWRKPISVWLSILKRQAP